MDINQIKHYDTIKNESMLLLCHHLEEQSSCKTITSKKGGQLVTINQPMLEQFGVKKESHILGLTAEEWHDKSPKIWDQEYKNEIDLLDKKAISTCNAVFGKTRGVPFQDGTLNIRRLIKVPLFSDFNSKKIVGLFSSQWKPEKDPTILETLNIYRDYYQRHDLAIRYFLIQYQCLDLFLNLPTLIEIRTLILVSNTSHTNAANYLNVTENTISSAIKRIKKQRLLNEWDYQKLTTKLNTFVY